MSYVFNLPGHPGAWPALQLGALPVSESCRKAAGSISDVGKYAGLSPAQTEKLIADCCSGFGEGGTAGERTARLAECLTRAGAAAYGSVACTVLGAPYLAGLCASVGGLLADRVIGYDTSGKVAFAAGNLACGPTCGFVVAELMGFFTDTLGPLVSGIFDPNAAKRRAAEQRKAAWAAYNATEEAMRVAETQTIAAWTASVNRIWSLYEKLFQTTAARVDATAALGISATYSSIVAAMIAAGVPYGRMSDADVKFHQEDVAKRGSEGAGGCEVYGKKRNGSYGPVSGLCPPFWWQRFNPLVMSQSLESAPAIANELVAQINDFFLRLQVVEAMLSTRIAMYATVQRATQAIKDSKSRTTLAVKAARGATLAEAAADAALKGGAEEGRRSVERAKIGYDLAVASYAAALDTFGDRSTPGGAAAASAACRLNKDCQKATAAVARANHAYAAAKENAAAAASKRMVVGALVATGAAGAAFLLLK